ncbi:heme exporter protein CcmD [Loktanella salsilacus]|nr:heme exporter protein CcmD [Loktanella salsilacus]MBU0781661.1 heme exporter protein CcmD [Alphaproteobacteria bacterium]MBU1793469.1 heme exporter protein CcmD [Alphaproteobacteria bacterium]UTH46931.1 heme exporter protein CcmD [Loktanella salsilacus]
MPDLGKYAFEVLTAYAASIAVLAVLIGASLRRSRRVKAALEAVERG